MVADECALKRGKGRPKGFDRERALCQALRIFWEKGYGPTSVAQLCEVMEINPPSLYCCFGNKASLFLEAVRYYERKYWTEPSRRFMEEADVYKGVRDFFNEAARILLSPHTPCGCMVVLAAVNISSEEKEIIAAVRQMRMDTQKMFADRLAKAVKDGQLKADADVPTIAAALNAFLEGLSLSAKDGIFLSQLLQMAACAPNLLPPRD